MSTTRAGGPGHGIAQVARIASLAVLVLAALLFAVAWAIGGQDAVSDNWVGVSVVLGLFSGLAGAFLAMVTAVVAGLQGEPWGRLLLPLLTFPGVVLVVVLMEAFVFE